ncbi:hypothetical protein, partial [Nostoc sp.]
EQCENVRSGFNYQLHRHILNKTRFISLRCLRRAAPTHPKIPISVLGFSTSLLEHCSLVVLTLLLSQKTPKTTDAMPPERAGTPSHPTPFLEDA